MPEDALLSVDDFAGSIKAKYPAYQNIDNKELTDMVVEKYPQYKTQIDFGPIAPAKPAAGAKSDLPPMPSLLSRAITAAGDVVHKTADAVKSLNVNTGIGGELVDAFSLQGMKKTADTPLGKLVGGQSLSEMAAQKLPESETEFVRSQLGAKSGFGYDLVRRGVRTAAGLADWFQTPLGIATAAAHVATEGADAVIGPLLGLKFSTEAADGVKTSLQDIHKNGATPENTEQLFSSLAMGVGGVAGAAEGVKAGIESHINPTGIQLPSKEHLAAIADETKKIQEREGAALQEKARASQEQARAVAVEAGKEAAKTRTSQAQRRAGIEVPGEGTDEERYLRGDVPEVDQWGILKKENADKEFARQYKIMEDEENRKIAAHQAEQAPPEASEAPAAPEEAPAPEASATAQPEQQNVPVNEQLQPEETPAASELPPAPERTPLAEAGNEPQTTETTDEGTPAPEAQPTVEPPKAAKGKKSAAQKDPAPPAVEQPKTPYQAVVDDAVHSELNHAAELFESSQLEDVGKAIRDVNPNTGEFERPNPGNEETHGRIGGGYKDGFAWLDGMPETPKMIRLAIRRGKGVLFERLKAAATKFITEDEEYSGLIQKHLDALEEQRKAEAGEMPDWVTEAQPGEEGYSEEAGAHESEADGETPADDHAAPPQETEGDLFDDSGIKSKDQVESDWMGQLAGGKKTHLLKEGKTFDSDRLEKSDLFGNQERQGKLGTGGSNAATAFPSAFKEAKEQVKQVFGKFSEAADDIKRTFAAGSMGEFARRMGGLLRETLSDIAARDARAADAVRTARNYFEKAPTAARLAFIDAIETGKPLPTAQLQTFADTMKSMRENLWREVQKRGGPKTWIDDYWVHFWKDPGKAKEQLGAYYARRPLLGAKDFLHKREIPTVKFGMEELGLEPLFDNPVDAFMTQAHQLHKYILMKDMVEEAKSLGVVQFVGAFDKAGEGMVQINDPIGTVYGPPHVTVKEAYDENMFSQINAFARSMGIEHYRKTQMRGGVWGYTRKGENSVHTRFAGPESVLTHEIGHQLDFRYGLADRLVKDPATRDELRTLADMRYEGKDPADLSDSYKRYVRKGTEKIANLIHALVHAPERAQEVAPNSVQALRELAMFHPELQPLFDIKPSLVLGEHQARIPVGGQVVLGHLYAPEPAGRILNNYLSPGLSGKAAYDVLKYTSNITNMAQLGFSGFHLTFTGMDSAISTAALGIQEFTSGNFRKGAINIGKATIPLVAPFENLIRGSRVLKELTKPGSQGEFYAKAVDNTIAGGGRFSMDQFYHNNAVQSFWDAFHAGKAITPLKAIPAMIEYVAKPIMSYWVPRQKLGIFSMLAEHEMEALGPDASRTDVRAAMGRAWDSVDNRMGQMVYDNLFWNRAVKDLGLVSVRSLGWNLGTFRELGGGIMDSAKAVTGRGPAFETGKFKMTTRMAYTLALPTIVGLYGSMLHYGLHGKGPENVKDAFFVPTGRENPDGTPERISMPSYMKDVFQYSHDFPYGATDTVTHKLNPDISMVFDMLRNQDFYGTKIRNEDDPTVQQVGQLMTYIGSNFLPFSLRNAQQRANADASSLEQAESFFGILPAPKWVDRSDAEQLAQKYVSALLPRGARTQAEADRANLRGQILKDFQLKKPEAKERLQKALQAGRLSASDEMAIKKDLNLTYLQRLTERIGLVDALNVYDKATPAEQNSIRPYVLKKAPLVRNMPPEMQQSLLERIRSMALTQRSNSTSLPPAPVRSQGATR